MINFVLIFLWEETVDLCVIITYLFLKQGVVELMREIHIWHFKTIRMATAVITLIMITMIIAMDVVIIIVMNTIMMVIVIVAVAVAVIHVSAIFQLNDIGVA